MIVLAAFEETVAPVIESTARDWDSIILGNNFSSTVWYTEEYSSSSACVAEPAHTVSILVILFFAKVTDKQLYTYRNILEYVDGEYQLTNKITDQNIHDMRANMDETDAVEFDKFVEKYWGKEKKIQKKSNIWKERCY